MNKIDYENMLDKAEYKLHTNSYRYTKRNGGLYNLTLNEYSDLKMSEIMESKFEEVSFTPKLNEKYWFADITSFDGIFCYNNKNDIADKRILKYFEVFRTRGEAIEYGETQYWWNV